MAKKRIILASTSPRRKELAGTMGLDFEIVPSNYEEDMNKKIPPKDLVIEFSHGKASDVAKKYNEGIVIGVDTIVVFKDKMLGKPKDRKHAFQMLKGLSGKTHEVYSGVCLIDCKTKKIIKDFEVTKVFFRKITDDEINKYLDTGEYIGKAGAYAIQGLASIFVKKIEGCYFNIMGLPVYNLNQNLKKMGVNIFDYDKWKGNKI